MKLDGTSADCAEELKCTKYASLAEAHHFEPIAFKSMGMYCWSTGVILRAIGCRHVEATREPWFHHNLVPLSLSHSQPDAIWFHHNLAIAIQRGNELRFSQSVERGIRGSEESSSTQPTSLFMTEFPLL